MMLYGGMSLPDDSSSRLLGERSHVSAALQAERKLAVAVIVNTKQTSCQ